MAVRKKFNAKKIKPLLMAVGRGNAKQDLIDKLAKLNNRELIQTLFDDYILNSRIELTFRKDNFYNVFVLLQREAAFSEYLAELLSLHPDKREHLFVVCAVMPTSKKVKLRSGLISKPLDYLLRKPVISENAGMWLPDLATFLLKNPESPVTQHYAVEIQKFVANFSMSYQTQPALFKLTLSSKLATREFLNPTHIKARLATYFGQRVINDNVLKQLLLAHPHEVLRKHDSVKIIKKPAYKLSGGERIAESLLSRLVKKFTFKVNYRARIDDNFLKQLSDTEWQQLFAKVDGQDDEKFVLIKGLNILRADKLIEILGRENLRARISRYQDLVERIMALPTMPTDLPAADAAVPPSNHHSTENRPLEVSLMPTVPQQVPVVNSTESFSNNSLMQIYYPDQQSQVTTSRADTTSNTVDLRDQQQTNLPDDSMAVVYMPEDSSQSFLPDDSMAVVYMPEDSSQSLPVEEAEYERDEQYISFSSPVKIMRNLPTDDSFPLSSTPLAKSYGKYSKPLSPPVSPIPRNIKPRTIFESSVEDEQSTAQLRK